ncbi:MAG TPA: PA2169 family four-helix-bundle protein [Flavobacterium sp.]|jgi:uncharacterized protein (TIGR02284 family)
MENSNQKTVDTLNGLIAILEDGKLGYKNAAEDIDDYGLKENFLAYSRERSFYIVQLQDEINKLGKSTNEADGGPLGLLHRTWIDIKAAFTSGHKDAIIDACITGEEAAIKKYTTALKENDFDPSLRLIIQNQLSGIEKTLSQIKLKKVDS